MTDVEETTGAAIEEDLTELSLRSWGLSGTPVTWAWTDWQPVVSIIRAANTGFADAAMVQAGLDAVFPDAGYLAANVCLAHPPTADFTIQPGTMVDDPTVYLDVIHVDLVSDEDLDLPNEQVEWDFGDGSAVAHDTYGWEHGYLEPGVYTVRCTIPVAGVLYSTAQEHTVGEPPATRTAPEYAERPATVFTDPDELAALNAELDAQVVVEEDAEDDEETMEAFVERLTVAEVLTYAEAHPDEVAAIIAAEEAGKGRAGILDKL